MAVLACFCIKSSMPLGERDLFSSLAEDILFQEYFVASDLEHGRYELVFDII